MILQNGSVYKKMVGGEYAVSSGVVVTNTRNRSSDLSIYRGKTVVYKGKKYYVADVDGLYFEIVSIDDVLSGSFTSGTDPVFQIGGGDFESYGYEMMRKEFLGDPVDDSKKDTVGAFAPMSNVMDPMVYYDLESGRTIVWVDDTGKVQGVIATTANENGGIVPKISYLKGSELTGRVGYYNPTLRLSVLGWEIQSVEGVLTFVMNRKLPIHVYDGLYPAALSRTVADTMIVESAGAMPAEDLTLGSVVLIGDTYFYKEEDGSFTSSPIPLTTVDMRPEFDGSKFSQKDLEKLALMILNIPVDLDGRSTTISNYVSAVRLGRRVDHEKFKYSNAAVAKALADDVPMIATDGKEDVRYLGVDLMISVSVNVKLDPGLVVLPKTTEGKEAEMLMTSTSDGGGKLVDESLFSKHRGTTLSDASELDLILVDFKPMPNQVVLKDEFKKQYGEQLKKDVAWWIRLFLFFIIGYLLMVCSIMWAVTRIATVSLLFQRIKYPTNKMKGVDLLRIITLGVMDIDTEVSGGRLFLSLTLLLLLAAGLVVFGS
jgi:hypothetical protein